jgi:hypothetical protein
MAPLLVGLLEYVPYTPRTYRILELRESQEREFFLHYHFAENPKLY